MIQNTPLGTADGSAANTSSLLLRICTEHFRERIFLGDGREYGSCPAGHALNVLIDNEGMQLS